MSGLTKPTFIKVKQLVDARNGYNVYAKVVKVEEIKSNDGLNTFVRAVVADETGAANAFFKGDTIKIIKEGAVIAIRNGKIRLIKNHISLEIDIFGRVTSENIQIKANAEENISEKQVERRKRERRPRREDDDEERPRRRPREDKGERRQDRGDRRQDRGERRERREDRGERREDRGERREDRRQRREERPERPREDKPREDRRERREDKPERPREDKPRQERPERRERREDRGERREDRGEGRFPRRDERRDENRGDRRPATQWTKVSAIEPGDENLSITAKVLSVEKVGRKARVILGDETGIVKAFFFFNESLEEGNTVVVFGGLAAVVKEHIEIQLGERGKVDKARREINVVNKEFDVSAKQWVEAA